jgi:hypothetical protein
LLYPQLPHGECGQRSISGLWWANFSQGYCGLEKLGYVLVGATMSVLCWWCWGKVFKNVGLVVD